MGATRADLCSLRAATGQPNDKNGCVSCRSLFARSGRRAGGARLRGFRHSAANVGYTWLLATCAERADLPMSSEVGPLDARNRAETMSMAAPGQKDEPARTLNVPGQNVKAYMMLPLRITLFTVLFSLLYPIMCTMSAFCGPFSFACARVARVRSW